MVLVGAEGFHVGVVEVDRALQRSHERLGVVGEVGEARDEVAQQQPHTPGIGLRLDGELAQRPQLGCDVRQRDRLQRAAPPELLVVDGERPLCGLAGAVS